MWERYCRGVQAIVFVIDAADTDALEQARNELQELLKKPSLQGIPLLVLGNKNDIAGALSTGELIDRLNLKVNFSSTRDLTGQRKCIEKTWAKLRALLFAIKLYLSQFATSCSRMVLATDSLSYYNSFSDFGALVNCLSLYQSRNYLLLTSVVYI